LNSQIADILLNASGRVLTIADSAEPKSIAEIGLRGVTILPSEKGKDSVASGIQIVQQQRISVTKRSVNTIKEYRNYTWESDKDGKILNVPIDLWNHSMDGIRYAIVSMVNRPEPNAVHSYTPKLREFRRT
jgi:phage terminase large subunit